MTEFAKFSFDPLPIMASQKSNLESLESQQQLTGCRPRSVDEKRPPLFPDLEHQIFIFAFWINFDVLGINGIRFVFFLIAPSDAEIVKKHGIRFGFPNVHFLIDAPVGLEKISYTE